MTLAEAVTKRIRELLYNKNMKISELEKLSTIPHSTMSCILGGRTKGCNLNTIMLIIRALNISTTEFFNDPIFESEYLILE